MGESLNSSLHNIIPETGLTVVVDRETPLLDIVFVHGFTGHPEHTWTHKKADPRPFAPDKPFEGQSRSWKQATVKLGPQPKRHCVFWPRDLVQHTVPNARVLTYGYDTHIKHCLGSNVNKCTIYEIASDFLVTLEANSRKNPFRPILFVGHSLGGIVIKEALRQSKQASQPILRNVFKSTVGIIFFGTPHSGADPRNFLCSVAEKLFKAMGAQVNEQIVDALLPSSERLRELRDEFNPMALKRKWAIHSFQEQYGVRWLNGKKVVEDTSSCINCPTIEIAEHIGRDHREMCRFTGLDDIEYKKVVAAFETMTSKVSRAQELRRQFLWNSLKFEQIDHRRMDIKGAHAKTCEWLLQNRRYLDWIDADKLNQHTGLLWIKGKPGAGKSTLMKFALTQSERVIKAEAVISFFFHARGIDLQKSTIGMYRSLLWQLLAKLPNLRCCFDSAGLVKSDDNEHFNQSTPQWSLEALKDLFRKAVLKLESRSLVCFIDALDECEESQIRDMLSFFEPLCGNAVTACNSLYICLSSRHYPNITISNGLDLVLEEQAGHGQDITKYLNSKLKIGHTRLAEHIRQDVQQRAAGVFMWVVLVVDMLNKEYDGGRIHALRKRLMNIPGDLHELFRGILTRDECHRNELLLCIQWVLFSTRPLSPGELYYAILSGIGSNVFEDLAAEEIEITPEDMQRFILDCSKGLVEIRSSGKPTVQFIHESVIDFLLKGNALGGLWTDLGSDFRGRSHEILKECCVTYMTIAISSIPGALFPKDSWSATQSLPFLEYAVQNILRHADLAEESHVPQVDFLEKFDWPNWLKLSDLFSDYRVGRHTSNASPIYIFAENDLPNLIENHPSSSSYFDLGDERYGSPLYASIITGSYRALHKFLELEVGRHPDVSLLGRLLNQFCSSEIMKHGPSSHRSHQFTFRRGPEALNPILSLCGGILIPFHLAAGKDLNLLCENWRSLVLAAISDRDESYALDVLKAGINLQTEGTGASLLLEASSRGWEEVIEKILSHGNIDVNIRNSQGMTPLCIAVQRCYKGITRLLLDSWQVQVNSEGGKGRTPLAIACRVGNIEFTKLLLATGKTTVNSPDKFGLSPLSHAASRGHYDIVVLLLQSQDVDVNSRDNSHRTPLSYAAEHGHEEVVRLLLTNPKIDINSKDRSSWSPLLYAACRGRERVVKLLLLQDKVNANLRCGAGYTALILAAREGHAAIVKLLLGRADVDVKVTSTGGISAMSVSRNMGHEEVAKILLASGKIEDGEIGSTVATTRPTSFSNGF